MIKIELTETELQALAGLLDAGVKTLGLRAVKDAASLLAKLEAAAQTENKEFDNA
jgi:hypothetical protein